MTKCPFSDPEFNLDVDTPCPVCGATGHIADWINSDASKKCEEASRQDLEETT